MFLKSEPAMGSSFWAMFRDVENIKDIAERDLTVAGLCKSISNCNSVVGLADFAKQFPAYEQQIFDGLLSGPMRFIWHVSYLETFCNEFPHYKKKIFEKILANKMTHFIHTSYDLEIIAKNFAEYLPSIMSLLLETNLGFIRRVNDLVDICKIAPEYKQKIFQQLFSRKLTRLIDSTDSVRAFSENFPEHFDSMMSLLLETSMDFIYSIQDLKAFNKRVPGVVNLVVEKFLAEKKLFNRLFAFNNGSLSPSWVNEFYKEFPEYRDKAYALGRTHGHDMPNPVVANVSVPKLQPPVASTVPVYVAGAAAASSLSGAAVASSLAGAAALAVMVAPASKSLSVHLKEKLYNPDAQMLFLLTNVLGSTFFNRSLTDRIDMLCGSDKLVRRELAQVLLRYRESAKAVLEALVDNTDDGIQALKRNSLGGLFMLTEAEKERLIAKVKAHAVPVIAVRKVASGVYNIKVGLGLFQPMQPRMRPPTAAARVELMEDPGLAASNPEY